MALPHKILIIEGDPVIRRLLRTTLRSGGYKVLEAANGKDGLQFASRNSPSVIILNRVLPDLDGIHVISNLRQSSDVPIIVLSDSNEDAIPALDALADDYITKPFSKEELIARVKKAIVQSAPALAINARFKLDSLEVDFMENRVFRERKEIHCAPIEFRLLAFLIKSAGKVLSPEHILRAVWGPGHENDKKCLRTVMHTLRQKVEYSPDCPKFLVTEIGIGYRLKMS